MFLFEIACDSAPTVPGFFLTVNTAGSGKQPIMAIKNHLPHKPSSGVEPAVISELRILLQQPLRHIPRPIQIQMIVVAVH